MTPPPEGPPTNLSPTRETSLRDLREGVYTAFPDLLMV